MNILSLLGKDAPPAQWIVREAVRRLARPLVRMDDFDWRHYHEHYRAEFASSARLYTHDLNAVDVRIVDGRLYLLADTKPLHPNHRCLWEAIVNLPNVASVGEVGVGGGVSVGRSRQTIGSWYSPQRIRSKRRPVARIFRTDARGIQPGGAEHPRYHRGPDLQRSTSRRRVRSYRVNAHPASRCVRARPRQPIGQRYTIRSNSRSLGAARLCL